ncbi:MAG: succinate dehydrogenase [Pseudomonadota bacterium]
MEQHLFRLQRISALVLAPLVLVHVGVIYYAIRGGLSAEEILGRTSGSALWGYFYGTFVAMAALHAPIGVRNVLREWTPLPTLVVDIACLALGIALLILGLRAVWIVTL